MKQTAGVKVASAEQALLHAATLIAEENTDSRLALVDALREAAEALRALRVALSELEDSTRSRVERVRAALEESSGEDDESASGFRVEW